MTDEQKQDNDAGDEQANSNGSGENKRQSQNQDQNQGHDYGQDGGSDDGHRSAQNQDQSQSVGQDQGRGEAHDQKPGQRRHHGRTMLVRYGKMGLLGLFRHSEREIPVTTKHVVVQSDRGLEIGTLLSPFCHHRGNCELSDTQIDDYCKASGSNYPLTRKGRFVRYATEQDLNEQWHLEKQAEEEGTYCSELIARYGLPMQLVSVEHLFGGDRIIYFFRSEGRVDFRSLVKELAHEYQTRIEMRQVGARDEARIVADFETCGRECCCKNFLKVLQPVSMRMAKQQKATLDPSKISGRCGRLKCCLRYEDTVYTTLSKKLPRNNTTVLTEKGVGVVVDTQVITQLAKVRLDSGMIIAIPVDELLERNYQRPSAEETPERSEQGTQRKNRSPSRKGRGESDMAQASSTEAQSVSDNGQATPSQGQTESDNTRSTSGMAQTASDDVPVMSDTVRGQEQDAQAGDNSEPGKEGKKRRRRRRRKKKPSGQGNG